MAIADDVIARYGSQYLVNLTNPYDPTQTTVDTTRLGLAVTDVGADFANRGLALDDAEAQHVNVAVAGVIAKLKQRAGMKAGTDDHKAYMKELDQLILVTARDRMLPRTDSVLEPSEEMVPGETVRPYFDKENLEIITPSQPGPSERKRSFDLS